MGSNGIANVDATCWMMKVQDRAGELADLALTRSNPRMLGDIAILKLSVDFNNELNNELNDELNGRGLTSLTWLGGKQSCNAARHESLNRLVTYI